MPTIEETRVLLVEKLKELFQLDQPDLDFGFYRIMHMRSKEITDFLEKDLLTQVKDALTEYTPVEKQDVQKRLNEAIKQAESLGADPETLPKVKELREKLSESIDMKQVECDVYDALYHFFSRYYSDGDFISQRVYKEGVYAIPYEGEEVKLHWANADQYYVKTCEYLRDYCFRTESNRRVHFKLVDATEGEHGNIKASEEKNRVFILAKDNFCAEENGELILRFEYRPATMNDWPKNQRSEQKTPPTQEVLLGFADARILGQKNREAWTDELGKSYRKSDGEDAEYSVLAHHLKRYAARNTFDYFIHKDLGTFLRRELDFFIKNEIMYLDDIEKETAPRVEQYLSQLRAIRRIAKKIITFLAQLEDFQKKLWLKKKFVVETNYCITLDRVPEEFYEEIAANAAQREEWRRLFDYPGSTDVSSASFEQSSRLSGSTIETEGSITPSLFDNLPKHELGKIPHWHSRGYLPHFDSAELQFITIRLFDSVPKETLQAWKDELAWKKEMDAQSPEAVALRKRINDYEDKGKGACFLQNPQIATMVQNALLQFDMERYRLVNWSIMPNHVHVLIEVLPDNSLSDIIKSWKSYTAHEANKILNRTGSFWMSDYFDRYIRNTEHYNAVNDYIDNNPVKGGLVSDAKEWEWNGIRYRQNEVGRADGRDDHLQDADETSTLPGNLLLDTKFFSEDFKQRLLDAIPNFDEQCDGLLIHSENFQALNLLQSRYREQVKCVYIDPPYNSQYSEVLYKNEYKHSSWLSLISNRVDLSLNLLYDSACYSVAIDDAEMPRLCEILDYIFTEYERNMVVVNHHPQGGMSKNVSRTHEYMLMYVPNGHDILKGKAKSGESEYRNFALSGPGDNKTRTGRPNSFYALLIDTDKMKVVGIEPPPLITEKYSKEETSQGYLRLYPISSSGEEKVWCRSYDSAIIALQNGEISLSRSGSPQLVVDTTDKRCNLMSNWTDSKYNAGPHGTGLIADILGTRDAFSYPKSIHTVHDSIESMTHCFESPEILDYYAGSGTTGHAVISLNREDGGHRKYILVEMGDHFNTALKPRIEKVVYSKDWKDGKPTDRTTGVSQCVKYIRLESYEDTLNNLSLSTDKTLFTALQYADDPDVREEYVLKYFLEEESRGSDSLLNIDHFMEPTEYRLKVKKPGSDESVYQPVDLLETFNYLIGLQVDRIAKPQRFTAKFKRDIDGKLILDGKLRRTPDGGWRFRTVTGTTLDGQRVLVIWRNRPGKETSEGMEQDNQVLDAWFNMLGYDSQGSEFNIIYVNGTNNIDNLNTTNELWKVRLIEDEFQTKMWE